MQILVTGATGFIGQTLVPYLLTRPDSAVTLLIRDGRNPPLPPALAPLRTQFNLVHADLRNFRLTARAVRQANPDVVIHLAALGATDPFLPMDTAVRHNLTGTLNLIRACFENNHTTGQLITARTPGELTAMNTYAASKAAAWAFCEMAARTRGWPIQGAMIFQAYGPGQPAHTLIPSAIAAARAGRDFPMTAGEQIRDWITVEDVAAGITALLRKDLPPATTVELGTGIGTSVADVVGLIFNLTDQGGRPRPGLLPSRPGEIFRQVAHAETTESLTGWRPAVTLSAGLSRLIRLSPK